MRAVLAAFLVTLAVMFVGASPARAADVAGTAGIRVHDGRLVEATGSDLVLRGVNYDFISYPNENGSFAAIKAAGANAVRVPLGIGHQWPLDSPRAIATVVGLCRHNRLICVLDAHDTTGFGQDKKAATMAEAVRFWIGVRDALLGQEDYVIINIANEPFGNGATWPWAAQTADAIRQLRAAGFKHTLMVDAPGWGQDESFIMRDNAQRVIAADPTGNTIFDIHTYGQFATAQKVNSYFGSFASRRLPIVVGEFSSEHEWGDPDEDAIMASAQAHHMGYFAWSWSGNDKQYSYLDLVNNFDGNSRTAWGQRFINGPNGLSTATHEATIYRNGTGGAAQTNGSSQTPQRVTVSDVASGSVHLSWRRRPGLAGAMRMTRYQVVAVKGGTETRLLTTNKSTATVTGLKPSTDYTFAVYAGNLIGHRSPRSALIAAVTPPAR
jgi:mannan endo-1,4-beta-mannosidase